jgi:hypothetical protein
LGVFRNGKPGHFGLPGMAEHAAQIGAKLQLIDGDGRGTKVVLLIPVALAFAEADKPATRNITLRTSSPPAHSNSPH